MTIVLWRSSRIDYLYEGQGTSDKRRGVREGEGVMERGGDGERG
jgi:hypothetical protein